jgi:hypothetical protein
VTFRGPVDPTLTQEDFAGLTLAQMRALYHGSAGGAAYDISWARDSRGRRVFLPFVRFVRVDVVSGKSEIDAFLNSRSSALGRLAPLRQPRLTKPGFQRCAIWHGCFSGSPPFFPRERRRFPRISRLILRCGKWRQFGDGSLFQWNATNQHLEVTWDSSRTNSLFYRPSKPC